MIHNRTTIALTVACIGGYLGGGIEPTVVGVTVAGAAGVTAIWYTPHAETIATQWSEYQAENSEEAGR